MYYPKPIRPFAKLPQYDFMRLRKLWIWSSVVCVALALGLLATRGLNYGIDFVGGKLVQVTTAQPMAVAEVRAAVAGAGFSNVVIQEYGAKNEYLIRLPGNDPAAVAPTAEGKILAALAGAELRRVEFVGPQVGSELKVKGLLALVLSFVGILIYVWLRFELRYGLGAILSLCHDVALTVGVLSLLQTEMTLTVLAAILTLIGYSLNDTIVVFDRIRENRARTPNQPLVSVLNLSVNQTMSRTIMTVSTTLIVLVCLYVWGGEVINDFSLVLIIGIVLGTYSSIFVASPVLLALEERARKKE